MIKLFRKDLKLFLKDKRAVLLTFLLPIVLISLFAFAFGGIKNSDSKPSPVKLLVSDEDNTETSKKIIADLDSTSGLQIATEELNKARGLVTKGKFVGVLALYKGFEDSVNSGKSMPVELFYDRAQEMQIGLIQPVLMNTLTKNTAKENITSSVSGFLNANFPGMSNDMREKIISDVGSKLGKSNSNSATLKMTSLVGEEKDNNLYLIQSVAGVAIMMLLFSITGLSSGLLDEKENGTLKRLLYSPIKPGTILFGKMLTAYVISIIQLTVMFIYTWLVFGLDITVNIPAIIMMIVSIAFAVSGIGIFLASISKSRAQSQGFGTLVILTMSAIGGSMIPIFIMPAIMQKLAIISVNYWGIQGFYDIFWRGLPTSEIVPKALILVGMGLLLIVLSLRFFRRTVTELA